MNYILETKQLTKQFKTNKAIDSVSIHVKKGAIYALIGKNGAGKSTLFRLITALLPDTDGEVRMFGQTGDKNLTEARNNLGFMMEANYFPYLTAKQNLEYFRKLKGISDPNEVDRVLRIVKMNHVDRKFKEFSMGMKQRVSIANALMGNPDIIMLDEPINGLDPEGIADFRHLVQKLNTEEGITFVISSHILDELGLMSTDFGFLDNGKLVEEITFDELKQKTKNQIVVKVDDSAKGLTVLEETYEGINYYVDGDGGINISGMNDRVEEVSRLLSQNELTISKLDVQEKTLSDYFLELVGEKGVIKNG